MPGKTGEEADLLICLMQRFLCLMKFGNVYRVSGKKRSVLFNDGKFYRDVMLFIQVLP